MVTADRAQHQNLCVARCNEMSHGDAGSKGIGWHHGIGMALLLLGGFVACLLVVATRGQNQGELVAAGQGQRRAFAQQFHALGEQLIGLQDYVRTSCPAAQDAP